MSNLDFIPLMVPDIQQHDIDAVVAVLQSGMLIQGSKVEELESNIAQYLGVRHAIAVSSGTASLHLALVAFGIGRGDEVIVPAFSYKATANVVELVGAKPVFVDIDFNTFNIDKNLIERAITIKTKAIIPVHEFGLACDIREICELAKINNIKIIEDAACALGATENGKFTGTFGNVGSFSFHPRKAITSGEGGILVTDDDELARKLRILRNHGIEIRDGKMEFVEAGFNYRLTDFQAALVNSQLGRLESIINYKEKLANIYFDELSQTNKIILPKVPQNKRHSWQSFHLVLDSIINRNEFIDNLRKQGVGTNYGAQCIPAMIYYKNKYHYHSEKEFPNAFKAYLCGIAIPLYSRLKEEQVKFISKTIIQSI
jgi:dTDP-4-amino-4,6-dideoxygalactose transaminase